MQEHTFGILKMMVSVADENLVNAGCWQSGRLAAPKDRLNIFTACFLCAIHDTGEKKSHDIHSHYFALKADLIQKQARVVARAAPTSAMASPVFRSRASSTAMR